MPVAAALLSRAALSRWHLRSIQQAPLAGPAALVHSAKGACTAADA